MPVYFLHFPCNLHNDFLFLKDVNEWTFKKCSGEESYIRYYFTHSHLSEGEKFVIETNCFVYVLNSYIHKIWYINWISNTAPVCYAHINEYKP